MDRRPIILNVTELYCVIYVYPLYALTFLEFLRERTVPSVKIAKKSFIISKVKKYCKKHNRVIN